MIKQCQKVWIFVSEEMARLGQQFWKLSSDSLWICLKFLATENSQKELQLYLQKSHVVRVIIFPTFSPHFFFFLILLLLTETNKLSNSSGFNKIRDSFRIGRRSRSSFDHFRGSVKKKKKTRIHTRSHAIHERRADEVRGRRVSAPRVEQ